VCVCLYVFFFLFPLYPIRAQHLSFSSSLIETMPSHCPTARKSVSKKHKNLVRVLEEAAKEAGLAVRVSLLCSALCSLLSLSSLSLFSLSFLSLNILLASRLLRSRGCLSGFFWGDGGVVV